jgi:hypothetical protein
MSNSLLSLYGASEVEGEGPEQLFPNLPDRAQCFQRVAQSKGYDLVILGGGLTGAVTAHQASLLGIRVLVLHESYFGSTAQKWSVGYRNLFRSPLLARLSSARKVGAALALLPSHLVSSLRMTEEHSSFIDAWVQKLCRGEHRLQKGELPESDEKAMIRETVLAARQEGAVCLSDVEISFVEAESATGFYAVGVRDRISEWSCEVRAGSLLLDPSIVRIPSSRLGRRIGPQSLDSSVYLRVVCRLCAAHRLESLQVVVGNCEGHEYLLSPTESPDVVELVLLDAGKDPQQVVERICQSQGIASSEVLFVGKFRQPRIVKHSLEQYGGLFFPRERGPWDSWLSSQQVIVELQRAAHSQDSPPAQVVPRLLPGALHAGDIERFRAAALAAQVPESEIARAVERWHGRVRYIPEFARGLELACPGVLRGEVELAYRSDQVATLEDLLFGSLGLESDPQRRDKVTPLAAALSEISGNPTPPSSSVG